MTTNILVTANYIITNNMYNKKKSKTEDYKEITELCVKSYKKNLVGLNEIIILKGEVKTYTELFKDIFKHIKEIHNSGDINMLFVDSDTICVKPTKIFGQFDKFNMFMYTDRKRICNYPNVVPCNYYEHLNPWFMSNIRYYPNEFDKNIWNKVQFLVDGWVDDVWAYECIIYNQMFYYQSGIDDIEKFYLPQYNYQLTGKFMNQNIKEEDANILHVHSSRDSKHAIEIMKAYTK